MHSLSDADRSLFAIVAEAAFENPFSESRTRLDQRLGGASGAGLTEALRNVRSALDRLRRAKAGNPQDYSTAEGRLVQLAILFDAFHRWVPDYDRLITRQESSATESLKASFASDVLHYLLDQGIRSEEALRFVGMFFQLRRAFYFIRRELVGSSPSMRNLRMVCWNNIFTHDLRLYLDAMVTRMEDFSTLLLGETGSGKGAVARALGHSGFIPFDPMRERFAENFAASFIATNLAQFPEGLIESELFGHRKGAFTGAISDRDGVFARCRPHGTIFLDEIGDVPLPVQIKLLNVLQERSFTPVGSDFAKRFHGRVIAATNRSLPSLREFGDFRDDFYYRLCSDVIEVPPLRTRISEDEEELPRMIEVMLSRQMDASRAAMLTSRVHDALRKQPGKHFPWPGNVRELEQAVRRILLSGSYHPEITSCRLDHAPAWLKAAAAGSMRMDELMAAYCQLIWNQTGSYEETARRTGLDRRTIKKYVTKAQDKGIAK